MKNKIRINKQLSYLIITVLVITILYLLKLLLQYSFFSNIKNAIFSIFFPFTISFLVVYIFHPVLYWFEIKFSIKTWVSTLIILLINIIILIILIEILFPILKVQIQNIIIELPKYFDELEEYITYLQERLNFLNNRQFYDTIMSIKDIIVENIGKNIIDIGISSILFSLKWIWLIIFIPILIFMMMKDYSLIYEKLSQFLIKHKRKELIKLLENINNKLGPFLRGEFIVMIYMFILSLLLLRIIGVPNALIFSIIIAISNYIPFIGPIFSVFILGVYTYFQSTPLFIGVLIILIIMKILDLYIKKSYIYKNKSKIHSLIVLAVIVAGSTLLGVIGLFISVPIYIIISETVAFYNPRLKKPI